VFSVRTKQVAMSFAVGFGAVWEQIALWKVMVFASTDNLIPS